MIEWFEQILWNEISIGTTLGSASDSWSIINIIEITKR